MDVENLQAQYGHSECQCFVAAEEGAAEDAATVCDGRIGDLIRGRGDGGGVAATAFELARRAADSEDSPFPNMP